jgi:hypothetical protein
MLLRCEVGAADTAEGDLSATGWLRAETLESVAELNEMSLALLAEQAAASAPQAGAALAPLAELWPHLDAAARRRAAACPYLLLEAGFTDPRRWQEASAGQVTEAHEPAYSSFFTVPAALEAARLVFTYAWHLASTQPAAARLFLGMPAPCAAAITRCSLRQMYALAERHPEWLRPRWSDRPEIWRELLAAAATGEGSALERARLHGLTLLAAEVRHAPQERPVRT